jgi:hypothetical protein
MKKIIFLLALAPLALCAQTYEVLFLGNSYTAANNLPNMVSEIALSLGDTVNYDSSTPGGCTLQGHTTNANSMNKINAQAWDFVVIQAQSQEPSFPPFQVATQTYPYAVELAEAIAANDSCTEPVFFMTWGRKNGDAANADSYEILETYEGMQSRLRDSYLEMGYTNNATVAPVGMAWHQSINTDPDFELYNGDGSHPNVAGSYLAACTFYSTLFQESCVGASYIPNGLTEDDATYLQEIATARVLDSTDVWNMFAIQSMVADGGITFEFSAEASNAESYYWEFGDGSYSNEQNPTYTYMDFGEYYTVTLTVYSNGGCLSTSQSLEVFVDVIESVGEQRPIANIHPNPVMEQLNVELTKLTSLQLFNALGEFLQEQISRTNTLLDMSNYPAGTYILHLTTDTQTQQIKIIKQ